jgi:hypothetical protein
MHTLHLQNTMKCQVPIMWVKHWSLNMQPVITKMCGAPPWPFSIFQTHSCNSCALAIATGSDKQNKCCRTHQVLVIAMKSKGNNNKPILKVVTTKTLQPLKRYHSADVCLPAVTWPHHNSFILTNQCTTCRSWDWDPDCPDNRTDVGTLNEDEDNCSGL